MKGILILSLTLLTLSYSCNNADNKTAKSDLKKVSWIEGNWKGMDGNNPFYEIYHIQNDSTLLITSYDWNGIDSSNSRLTHLVYMDGNYYLGDEQNWKVTEIKDESIYMEPVKNAVNSILWKKTDKDTWEALLEMKTGKKVYQMVRVDLFSDAN